MKEREVAEHSSEHMGEFFRLEGDMMDSITLDQIKLGTEHEHGGTVETWRYVDDFYLMDSQEALA